MKSKILNYRTVIEKDGKYYHGYVPILPGCHTQGKTIDETRQNLQEAIKGWLESSVAHNLPIPKEKNLASIEIIDIASIQAPVNAHYV